tara:strand:+ start:14593 stop:15417 length:825 start_codon:yes stop_codon:yes gene_type:complete
MQRGSAMHIVQNMVRPALFGLLASIFILLAAPERAIAGDADALNPPLDSYDAAQVERFFIDVALGPRRDARIVKWSEAPTVRLETLVADPDIADQLVAVETPFQRYAALATHVGILASETGLPVRLMLRDVGRGTGAEEADIVISIVPRLGMRYLDYPGVPKKLLSELMGPSRCFFIIWPTPEWGIARAQIVINASLEDHHIHHCFIEELTQAFGLPNDSERLSPSVFNETSMQVALSRLDALFVRTLYDPNLRPGTLAHDVKAQLGDLLRRQF